MIDFVKLILSLSLSGTILILILVVLRPIYSQRLSKHWQYYVWIVVIARLLLPITLPISLMGNLFSGAEQLALSDAAADTQYPASITSSVETDTIPDSDAFNNAAANGAPGKALADDDMFEDRNDIRQDAALAGTGSESKAQNADQPINTEPKNHLKIVLTENTVRTLLTIWLVIALLLFVRKITVYQSFVKYVNAGSRPIDDIALLERFGHIVTQNQIRQTIDLCSNNLVSSPLLIGFVHPRIVLPDTNLSENDFYYTVLHELIHYKRRDMFYKWLVQLTICLHWFNPFVYLMEREINRLCELSCDERVIESLPENARKSYGDTLINAIGTGGSYRDTLASVTLNESKELLKGRLDAIMKYRKISRPIKSAAIFMTGILIGGAAVLGAYASPADSASSDTGISSDSETVTADDFSYGSASHTDNESRSDSSILPASEESPDQASSYISQTPDYSIQYEDGTYYIFTDGATEADKPLSAFTGAYKHLVLVWQDGYSTFGSWNDYEMQSLTNHITEQCRTRIANGQITQEHADIVISAAAEIQELYRSKNNDSAIQRNYRYTQAAYYQHPYIIELGYNLPASSRDAYRNTTVTLASGTPLSVYFSNETADSMTDEKAMSAISALVARLFSQKENTAYPLETPFLVSMEYVGDASLDTLAEKYYSEEMLTYFGAVFLELDNDTKQEYLDLMFAEGNISFFACCVVLSDAGIQKSTVDHYILRAYQENKINFFSVLAGELDAEARKQWLEKCKRDGKSNYQYILAEDDDFIDLESGDFNSFDFTDFEDDNFDFSDFEDFENFNFGFSDFEDSGFDFLEQLENGLSKADAYDALNDDLEDKGILEEYNENGIVTIKNSYYYQNARIRLLVDVRSDGSFENSSYDGRGSVDLKLLRDKNNKIVHIEYLSAEEAAKIIKDMDIFPSTDSTENTSSILDLNRTTKQELPDDLLDLLDSCDSRKWYVINAGEYRYIYYNGLPHTYAYAPHIDGSETGDLITVAIMSMESDSSLPRSMESLSDYVLLRFAYTPGRPDMDYKLAITYNNTPVTYESITAEQLSE